jgi:hypothetical protein
MTQADRQILQICFSTSQPEGTAMGHVVPGAEIGGTATWSIQTLNCGPLRSSPAYEQHLRGTVGSSYDWSDEFRFDNLTGRLLSFILKTPETGLLDPEVAGTWLALPRQPGVPVLDERENGFHIDPLDLRFLANDASSLVAADRDLSRADRDSLRLEIGPDVDLLFQRSRYRGWILNQPVAHLVGEPGDKIPGTDEAALHDCLRQYIALVIQPNIDLMSDEDPGMRLELQQLRTRIHAIDAVQARALERAVERILETFYPG